MARRVFYSFYFKQDSQRVSQVKNMGVVEGQPILSSNEWEEVKKGRDKAIEDWIAAGMKGKPSLVVLIGSATAGRRWVDHEITKAWNDSKGVVGVYSHNLKNLAGLQSSKVPTHSHGTRSHRRERNCPPSSRRTTPLPRPTHHRCLWRGQMQSVEPERADSSSQRDERLQEGWPRGRKQAGGAELLVATGPGSRAMDGSNANAV